MHTHILPERWPNFKEKFGYGGFIRLEHHKPGWANMMKDDVFFREIESNCWDPKVRIDEYAKMGTQVQVVSTVPVMFSYWAKPEDTLEVSKFLNDHLADVIRDHPKHYAGLATIPMQAPKLAVQELERSVKDLGLDGIQIGSHIGNWNLDAPELFPIFEAAQELDACILVHPWDMMAMDKMPKYWLPWLVGMPAESALAICSLIFGGVMERLPKLRFAFAHGGGSFPFTLGRIEHGFNVRPDLCQVETQINPRDYLGKFFVDCAVHDDFAFKYLVELMGEDHVLLGTDYPFPLGEHEIGKLISESSFSDEAKEKMLSTNVLRFLGRKIEDFQ